MNPDPRVHSRRGQSLVEFCIIALPVLILLGFGVVEFGRMVGIQNRMAAACREGARLYMRYDIDVNATDASAKIQTNVVTPMLNSMVQVRETQATYTILVSSLLRLDGPNRTTSTSGNKSDDVIIIDRQFAFTGNASISAGSLSRIGPVDTVLARNVNGAPDTTKLLTLDYLESGEESVCVEVTRNFSYVTPLAQVMGFVLPANLYDRCFF